MTTTSRRARSTPARNAWAHGRTARPHETAPPAAALTRRDLMGLMAGGAVLGFASACSGTNTEGGDERPGFGATPPKPRDNRGSPMRAAQGPAGKLPPVRERLPKEPFIVRPGFLVSEKYVPMEPGKYGGRLELPQEQPAFDPHVFLGNIEPLLAAPNGFDYDAGIVGNVLAGYEA